MSLGHHLVLRLIDNRVLATSNKARQDLTKTAIIIASNWPLLAFRLVDTHIHILIIGNRTDAGELARRVEIALQRKLRLEIGFATAYIKQVIDQRYLYQSFSYILNQNGHHGVDSDPYHEGSTLLDLLGLRILDVPIIKTVNDYLPRIKRDSLLPTLKLDPNNNILSFDPLPLAASSAIGCSSLNSRSSKTIVARRAAMEIAAPHVKAAELAQLLQVSPRTLRRLKFVKPDQELVKAIDSQLRMRQKVEQKIEQKVTDY